jgi:hypothetical protein
MLGPGFWLLAAGLWLLVPRVDLNVVFNYETQHIRLQGAAEK